MATMITILSIGNKPPTWIEQGCEYYGRMIKSKKIKQIHLNAISTKNDTKQRQQKEFNQIKTKIPHGAYVIGLDEQGDNYTSKKFADYIDKTYETYQEIIFIVGPSDGMSDDIKKLSHKLISLSTLTFTHDIAKLLLIEGLYRSQCITNNHPYHRE